MRNTSITEFSGFQHLSDLPCLRLQFGQASAVVSLYGGQVLSYQPTPTQELLWLSPLARWQNQYPIRGGVPVCWPWFGPATSPFNIKQSSLPNHGVVRTRMWQIVQQHCSEHAVQLTLSITIDDLPHAADSVTLLLTVSLTDSLDITLNCDAVLPQQAALHSYFNVIDIHHTTVSPLPTFYQDKVSASDQDDDSGQTGIEQEVDRIYWQPADKINITDGQNTLTIAQQGQDATVVWNPWQVRSTQIADLDNDSYLGFVCVETARLSKDPLPLQLSQRISG